MISLKNDAIAGITQCDAKGKSEDGNGCFSQKAGSVRSRCTWTPLCRCAVRILSVIFLVCCLNPTAQASRIEYVIVMSVDGGGAYYIENLINQGRLPNFNRLKTEGVWTHNARCDFDNSSTLPNHVTMVTARGVHGSRLRGHFWTRNTDPSNADATAADSIQRNNGAYVHGVFDMAHDNGLRTGLFTTKRKFGLFKRSYDEGNGAPDTTGFDNGRNKISTFVFNEDAKGLMNSFLTAMHSNPCNYVIVHLSDADMSGHAYGWGSAEYCDALMLIDGYIGQILDLVTGDALLKGKTSIIVTADHGGVGKNHGVSEDPVVYTIPFYVWGPDVDLAKNLYTLNPLVRLNPGLSHPSYDVPIQPIRHGDSANLAMRMLGLGIVPGSTINNRQELRISTAPSIDGGCGNAHEKVYSEAPRIDLCASGEPSMIEGNGPWTWKCIGRHLGLNAGCVAYR
jgi:hypothetical protein